MENYLSELFDSAVFKNVVSGIIFLGIALLGGFEVSRRSKAAKSQKFGYSQLDTDVRMLVLMIGAMAAMVICFIRAILSI